MSEEGPPPDKETTDVYRRVLVGYPRVGKTLILNEAVARVAKLAPQTFGYDSIAIAQPMPEPEPEAPAEAHFGMSARNSRRLAKKNKRK